MTRRAFLQLCGLATALFAARPFPTLAAQTGEQFRLAFNCAFMDGRQANTPPTAVTLETFTAHSGLFDSIMLWLGK